MALYTYNLSPFEDNSKDDFCHKNFLFVINFLRNRILDYRYRLVQKLSICYSV